MGRRHVFQIYGDRGDLIKCSTVYAAVKLCQGYRAEGVPAQIRKVNGKPMSKLEGELLMAEWLRQQR